MWPETFGVFADRCINACIARRLKFQKLQFALELWEYADINALHPHRRLVQIDEFGTGDHLQDFSGGFHHWGDAMNTDGRWDPGKDFAMVSARETGPTQKFMAIWRASKPVIAQVHGWCVGGASDYALCADIVIASDDAVIGTPYARMWGAYLTGMWLYRLSLAKAKWHSLTGEPLTGKEAAAVELINESVPFERLEARVKEVASRLANIPLSQLQAQKLVVNQAYENMGLTSTQTLGGILDGLMRNTPDAKSFIELASSEGVSAAVARRDGPFGDYSQAPAEERPDPNNVIVP